MPRGRHVQDLATLQMALVGYQIERQKIDDKIREIENQLKAHFKGKMNLAVPGVDGEGKAARTRRELSPAARKRIAAAQKRRWAEHRKRMAQAPKES